ncbi:hypothetical protein AQJ43_07460 [Streptomyces avermitilis]|uniref:Secreted protein n=2 Tax=Streptomyces avermitilis TaxID=33903 RepID=Q82M48_STRAW|nr:hypothetical protein AQJ43_07460 [Streptomyces avermitilis]BAC69523.1 putative secreted protein [Streptomyces avermitilis MA-4680 = NBRC 14893]OOV25333.1 hypothetical protein SM007_25985 [Streptomyces avermitilis]BBJ49527.1 hypothetical protein SAVMC3_21560 [Streptomyces avermitilis]GDY61552.1 hypothetical protein SAV14893_009450 [Streptomyces avermitilis]
MKRTDARHGRAASPAAARDTAAPRRRSRPGRSGVSVLAAMCAVASLALTGCTRDTDRPHPTSPVAKAERTRQSPELTYAEDLRISDAEQHLVKQCMARHGYRFWEERTLTLEESRPVGYVQDDVRWARTHGYGSRIMAKEDRARLRNPNLAYRASLPTARQSTYDTALDGGRTATLLKIEAPGGGTITKRSGGCTGEAEKKLYGDPKTWFRADSTVSNLRPLYVGKLLRDQEFSGAVRDWSRCMRRAGHPYRDPNEARQAMREHGTRQTRAAEARTFAAETRTATADAGCARAASLKSIGKEREAHYVGELSAEYGDALDTYRRLKRAALAHAEQIVPARA